jgi:hypothetical protein
MTVESSGSTRSDSAVVPLVLGRENAVVSRKLSIARVERAIVYSSEDFRLHARHQAIPNHGLSFSGPLSLLSFTEVVGRGFLVLAAPAFDHPTRSAINLANGWMFPSTLALSREFK